jgi:hypothetical protein
MQENFPSCELGVTYHRCSFEMKHRIVGPRWKPAMGTQFDGFSFHAISSEPGYATSCLFFFFFSTRFLLKQILNYYFYVFLNDFIIFI